MSKVFLLSFLFPVLSIAQTGDCREFARGAAEAFYLTENTGIQGHVFDSLVKSYKVNKKDKTAQVVVTIDGQNDEGDSWGLSYDLVISLPRCQVVEYSEGRELP